MTVQSVIRDVCSFLGVRPPNGSVFVSPYADRTSWEMVLLANEMAQRIALDTRDWQVLRQIATLSGTGAEANNLPANFHRLLKNSNVWRSSNTNAPMTFVSDPEDWLIKKMQQRSGDPMGEWMIEGGQMYIRPALAALVPANPGDPIAIPPIPATPEIPAETAQFYYLRNTCIRLNSGSFGTEFTNDADTFVLPERLLKLGMVWQWKAYKGATYAEDIANYEDALSMIAGNDKPSPILIGHQPVSAHAQVAYWGPVPPAGTFVGPGS